MDLAVDTNALVYAHVPAFPEHPTYRAYLNRHLASSGNRLVVSPLVAHEWLHVVTDSRRFNPPLAMSTGIDTLNDYLSRPNVTSAPCDQAALTGALDLIKRHRLGRRRIADALLAASLRACGVMDLLTNNARDFQVFGFLIIHRPTP